MWARSPSLPPWPQTLHSLYQPSAGSEWPAHGPTAPHFFLTLALSPNLSCVRSRPLENSGSFSSCTCVGFWKVLTKQWSGGGVAPFGEPHGRSFAENALGSWDKPQRSQVLNGTSLWQPPGGIVRVNLFLKLCVCVCYMCHDAHVEIRGQHCGVRYLLPLHSGDWTQVVSKPVYPENHLTDHFFFLRQGLFM